MVRLFSLPFADLWHFFLEAGGRILLVFKLKAWHCYKSLMTLVITGTAGNSVSASERPDYAVGVCLCVHALLLQGSWAGDELISALGPLDVYYVLPGAILPLGISSLTSPLLIPFGLAACCPSTEAKKHQLPLCAIAARSFLLMAANVTALFILQLSPCRKTAWEVIQAPSAVEGTRWWVTDENQQRGIFFCLLPWGLQLAEFA